MQLFEKGDHLTVRVHDTKLVEQLNYILTKNPFRYKYKNDLLVELIAIGAKEKIRELTPMSTSPKPTQAPQTVNLPTDTAVSLKQVKTLIENMHVYNQKHIEGIVAHLKMSEKLSAAIYNTLLAVATDEPITKVQIEFGFFDEVPERFEEYLNEQLKEIFKNGDSGGGKKGGELKS